MIGTEWLVPMVVGVGAAVMRRRSAHAVESDYASRFPVDANGIAEGAQAYTLTGTNGRSLLLVHGFGDTPQSIRYVADRVHEAGYTVHAPLLPGHGRSPQKFAVTSPAEYYEAARQALAGLRPSEQWVGVVGQSMGGAISARLASESPDVQVLVLLAPYLVPTDGARRAAASSWMWGILKPYVRGQDGRSVHDPAANMQSRAYGSFSPGALRALIATADAGLRALPKLTLPTLVVFSEQDNRIPKANAMKAMESLRAPSERHWVTGCGHVIAVDYCKDKVTELLLDFLARHAD